MRPRLRISPGVAAIAALAIAWAVVMHALGWAQLASYAQVRALSQGRAEIDRWHWETKDKAWINGHFYSVKAPGLAFATLPEYMALDAIGTDGASRAAVANVRKAPHERWRPYAIPPYFETGFSEARTIRIDDRVELDTPVVWALTLLGAIVPAVAILLLVRRLGDRIEPHYGTAAAVTLALGTILLTFGAEYFPHVIAAGFGFGAFAVLFRERRVQPRTALVGAAGLLAGLAVTCEYPLALLGAILFVYALARERPRLPRAAAYAAGALLGAAPVLAFNQWAFGSPFQFAYADAVALQGLTGHEVLGLNDSGFFGISLPDPVKAWELLLAGRGLLALTPVVAMAVAGTFAMRRGSHRAEANVILAVAAVYFLYNAGYWLPFGGGSPGPRFLIATLPFLGLGLAVAWRRWPAPTLALAIPSATCMLAAALTHPLSGEQSSATWVDRVYEGELEHTLLTAFGVHNAWLAMLPVLLAIAAAVAFAARATPRVRVEELRGPLTLLFGWAALAAVGPTLAGDDVTPLSGGGRTLALIAAGTLASTLTLCALRYREWRAERTSPAITVGAPVLGERSS